MKLVQPALLLLLLFGLELALFAGVTAGWLDILEYVAVHLCLCLGIALLAGYMVRAGRADLAAALFQVAAWTALAGPFGVFIAVGLLVPRTTAAEQGAEADPAAALSRLELLHNALLDRRLRLEDVHPVRPLLDVIIHGTQAEKFDALGLIHKRFVPALAPALRRAIEDSDGSVRVLAATVMAQQNNTHTRRIGQLLEAAKAEPDAAQRWRELGQAHLDYGNSGLLETSRAAIELERGQDHLSRAQQLDGRPAAADATSDHQQWRPLPA